MKLTIGENIRRLRREKDMTQEQLADRLGLTYQSVSRWENGTAYPDMELLPPLAQMFGVSIDELLGMPSEAKDEKKRRMIDDFCKATFETPTDFEKLKAMLAEIRRDGYHWSMWRLWLECNYRVRNSKEMLPEYRRLAELILEGNPQDSITVNAMVEIEDDEHIGEFLKKYSYSIDLLYDNLLRRRYQVRGEKDKFEAMKQYRNAELIDMLVNADFRDSRKPADPEESLKMNGFSLGLLQSFCGETPTSEHPIAPKGEIDFFATTRTDLGFGRACCLGALGDKEGALAALEDTVGYLEKAMKITKPVKIGFGSPWIKDISAEAYEDWSQPDNNPTQPKERSVYMHYDHGEVTTCSCIYPSWYLNRLTASNGFEGFDSIRNEPRYKDCVERVKALVVYEDKK